MVELLAFVVVAVWEDYHDTETAVRNEAKALIDLHQASYALPEDVGNTMRKHLVSYAEQVRDIEWPAMAKHYIEREGKAYVIDDGQVNLGIAVDVEKKDGSRALMVPAIKGADQMDFPTFHASYEDLITKTRENRLTPGPMPTTVPATSIPATGFFGRRSPKPRMRSRYGLPAIMCQVPRSRPAACTRTSTSSSATSGLAISAR